MTAKHHLEHQTGPILVIEYIDPEENFRGWLVINGLSHSLCAGGMRVQTGLTREHMIDMAENMSLKMRICNLPIDGAKCGIDYDPMAPGKRNAMLKFMAAIKPYITSCYSMGPDLNTDMAELESIANELDIPSVKIAIANNQGMETALYNQRYELLLAPAIDGWPLGKIRAGYGVAMAALATMKHLEITPDGSTIAVQGFGNLAKACIIGLVQSGAQISAIADAKKCYIAKSGNSLPLDFLLHGEGTLMADLPEGEYGDVLITSTDAIYTFACDILVLAAVENVITAENAAHISTKAIIPGANLAVTNAAEPILFERGIIALPSFMAGCGGSLSMNGLFGPVTPPSSAEVLGYIKQSMSEMTENVLTVAQAENISPTEAALKICRTATMPAREKPYAV